MTYLNHRVLGHFVSKLGLQYDILNVRLKCNVRSYVVGVFASGSNVLNCSSRARMQHNFVLLDEIVLTNNAVNVTTRKDITNLGQLEKSHKIKILSYAE